LGTISGKEHDLGLNDIVDGIIGLDNNEEHKVIASYVWEGSHIVDTPIGQIETFKFCYDLDSDNKCNFSEKVVS